MGVGAAVLDDPSGNAAGQSRGHTDDTPQHRVAAQGQTHGVAAEDGDQSGKHPENQGIAGLGLEQTMDTGTSGSDLPAELGVMEARAVDDALGTKEGPEDPVLVLASLVAHGHPLVQQDPAVLIDLNMDVTQLGPLDHHHGQVCLAHG